MANVHDTDTAVWLHNKLGSKEELWIPSSISGIIKTTKIDNILRCFHKLNSTVKVKLLLGILHLPRRNLDEMKHTLEGIIEKALEDTDSWVKLVANMVKNYPLTVNLNLDLHGNQIAEKVIEELTEIVPASNHFSTLPLECKLVNKSALKHIAGVVDPPTCHFAVKKRTKSDALRTDLMKKCTDARNHMKKLGSISTVKAAAVKQQSTTRRSTNDNMAIIKGISSRLSREGFRTGGTPGSASKRMNRQQAGGTKLLDISEQPISTREHLSSREPKRRKKNQVVKEETTSSQDNTTEREAAAVASNNKTTRHSTDSSQNRLNSVDESVNSDVVKKEAAEVTTVAAPVAEVKVEEQQQSSDVEMSEVYADFDDAESLQPESGSQPKESVSSQHSASFNVQETQEADNESTEESESAEPEQQSFSSPRPNESQQEQAVLVSPLRNTTAAAATNNSELNLTPTSNSRQQPPQQFVTPTLHRNRPVIDPQVVSPQQVQILPAIGDHLQSRMLVPMVAASSQGTNTQQYFEAEISANHPRLQQQHNVHQQPLQTSQQQEQLMPSSPVGLGLGSPMPDFLNPKKSLTLTREQMYEAQEIFRNANRLSRPEKAVILGFIAGSRENPYPNQGDLVRVSCKFASILALRNYESRSINT